jgi:hypothetical protein
MNTFLYQLVSFTQDHVLKTTLLQEKENRDQNEDVAIAMKSEKKINLKQKKKQLLHAKFF